MPEGIKLPQTDKQESGRTRNEKLGVILTWKDESLAELKFDPGFQKNGEYLSQFDSQNRVNWSQIFSNDSEYRFEF